jgi:hypothetical protein
VPRVGAGDCRPSRRADESARSRQQREEARPRPARVEAPTLGAGQTLLFRLRRPPNSLCSAMRWRGACTCSGHPHSAGAQNPSAHGTTSSTNAPPTWAMQHVQDDLELGGHGVGKFDLGGHGWGKLELLRLGIEFGARLG